MLLRVCGSSTTCIRLASTLLNRLKWDLIKRYSQVSIKATGVGVIQQVTSALQSESQNTSSIRMWPPGQSTVTAVVDFLEKPGETKSQ